MGAGGAGAACANGVPPGGFRSNVWCPSIGDMGELFCELDPAPFPHGRGLAEPPLPGIRMSGKVRSGMVIVRVVYL